MLFTSPDATAGAATVVLAGASGDKQAAASRFNHARGAESQWHAGQQFGNQEVWVNGEGRLRSGANAARIQLLNRDKVQVRSPGAAAHDMKPGQVLDPDTGQLREA